MFEALSFTVRVPVFAPVDVGLKKMLIVQLAPAARVDPQLVFPPKFVVTVILLMDKVLEVPFFSVRACVAVSLLTLSLPKDKLAGVSVTVPPAATPVPERLAVCGLLLALSVTVKVPLAAPVAVGLKVTLMLQELLAAREVPQVLVSLKLPLAAMLLMVMELDVPLFNVTVCAALVVFTVILPKFKLVGLSDTTPDATGVPASALIRF